MKRWQALAMLFSVPLLLAAVVWQAGRVAALMTESRGIEEEQLTWVDANRRLLGSIAVLESRERAAQNAAKLGLERATADKRIFIEMPGGSELSPAPANQATATGAGSGRKDG